MSNAILMEHPEHGKMHVYNQSEVIYNASNGWKRVKVEAKKVVEPPVLPPEEAKKMDIDMSGESEYKFPLTEDKPKKGKKYNWT